MFTRGSYYLNFRAFPVLVCHLLSLQIRKCVLEKDPFPEITYCPHLRDTDSMEYFHGRVDMGCIGFMR